MFEDMKIPLDEVESGEHYKNCMFSYANDRLHFSDVTFERCEFQQRELNDSEWLDCRFVKVDLSNKRILSSFFYRCTFEGCQLTGTNFDTNKWKDNHIVECKCNCLSFGEAIVERCTFTDANLKEAFFQDVKVRGGLMFDCCDLTGSDFSGTKLNGVDFSKSTFDSLRLSPDLVKGCSISPMQSMAFVALLGINIKDR